jgi:hypothetical protein
MQHVSVLLWSLLLTVPYGAPAAAAPAHPMADDAKERCGGYYACIERRSEAGVSPRRLAMLDTQLPSRPEPSDLPSAACLPPRP